MKLHLAASGQANVWGDLARCVQLGEGESFVAFYDETMRNKGTDGLLLTTRHLILLRKGKPTREVELDRIEALRVEKKLGATYLVAHPVLGGLEQAFYDRTELERFLTEASQRVRLKGASSAGAASPQAQAHSGPSSATAAHPQVEALKAPLNDPKVRAKLEQYVPLEEGEEYLACMTSNIFGSYDDGLVLTNQCLVSYKKQAIVWSVPLSEIQGIEYSKNSWQELHVHAGGQTLAFSVRGTARQQTCEALASIVLAAQGKGGEAGPTLSLLPEHGGMTYTLQEAVLNPAIRAKLETYAPLEEGEEYLAFFNSGVVTSGDTGLLLTNQCLLSFNREKIEWSLKLKDLVGIEYSKVMNLHMLRFRERGGHTFQTSVAGLQELLACRALAYLIAQAQGKAVGDLRGMHLIYGGEVVIPWRERFFTKEGFSGWLVLRSAFAFPNYCAWCKSPDVVLNQEVRLRAKYWVKKGSMARQIGGLFLATVTLVGGLALYKSGQGLEGTLEMVLAVPACERHKVAVPPEWHLADLDLQQQVCFVDFRDRGYAEEVCRCNEQRSGGE